MDSKESHIITFVRMATVGEPKSWKKGGTAPQVLLVMVPRADKSCGETRESGHKGTYGSLS